MMRFAAVLIPIGDLAISEDGADYPVYRPGRPQVGVKLQRPLDERPLRLYGQRLIVCRGTKLHGQDVQDEFRGVVQHGHGEGLRRLNHDAPLFLPDGIAHGHDLRVILERVVPQQVGDLAVV